LGGIYHPRYTLWGGIYTTVIHLREAIYTTVIHLRESTYLPGCTLGRLPTYQGVP